MSGAAHPAKNFAMVPVRTFADKRFRARHFRVLGALCKSYDSATGCAHVSQAKIAERANLSRLLVNRTLPDLIDWGYVTRTKRGRRLVATRSIRGFDSHRVLQAGAGFSEPQSFSEMVQRQHRWL